MDPPPSGSLIKDKDDRRREPLFAGLVTNASITTVPAAVRLGLAPLPLAPLAFAAERVVRSIAERHPRLFARLGPHAGKRFLLEPTDLPFVFVLEPNPGQPRVGVARPGEGAARDARIAGPLAALLGLIHGAFDGDALFFSRDIVIEGDVEAVLALRNALDDAELDLLAETAAVLGPLAAPFEQMVRMLTPTVTRLTGLALTRTTGKTP